MSTGNWERVRTLGAEPPHGAMGAMPIQGSAAGADDDAWHSIEALRAGDEAAFGTLVGRYHAMLVRMARLYLPDGADEVAQAVWIELLHELDAVDSPVSVRVTLLRMLLAGIRRYTPTLAARVPFAAAWDASASADPPAVSPTSFLTDGPWVGHWAVPVADWTEHTDGQPLASSARLTVEETVAMLPPAQREVILLRDVEGWTASEVCAALGIAETTQRTLLHRARSRVRTALDASLQAG